MKKIMGIISKYDGLCGIIIDDKKIEYSFSYDNIIGDEIRMGDYVTFMATLENTPIGEQYIAHFISKK